MSKDYNHSRVRKGPQCSVKPLSAADANSTVTSTRPDDCQPSRGQPWWLQPTTCWQMLTPSVYGNMGWEPRCLHLGQQYCATRWPIVSRGKRLGENTDLLRTLKTSKTTLMPRKSETSTHQCDWQTFGKLRSIKHPICDTQNESAVLSDQWLPVTCTTYNNLHQEEQHTISTHS